MSDPLLTPQGGASAPPRGARTTYAPDGSPVEAFAVLPPGPAPDLLDGVLPPAATILDLGGGAGRIAHALAAKGHRVTVVDQCEAMLDHVDPEHVEKRLADIEELDLGRTFDAVVLASFLVNTPHDHQRDAFLATCERHVADGGAIYVQRLDPELVPLAVDAESEDEGFTYAMSDVRHDGPRFAATMAFRTEQQSWQHRYEGVVLDDDDLVKALAPHHLRIARYLDDQRTWVEIRTA